VTMSDSIRSASAMFPARASARARVVGFCPAAWEAWKAARVAQRRKSLGGEAERLSRRDSGLVASPA
jgi:hypothetical protein